MNQNIRTREIDNNEKIVEKKKNIKSIKPHQEITS